MKKYLGNYILEDWNGIYILKSPLMSQFPELKHFFTTRKIDKHADSENLGELNMSVSSEDFTRHFEFLAKKVNISTNRCVFSHQVHSKNVKVVTSEDIGDPYWNRKLKDIDGLITSEKNLYLVTTYADCMPILAYDPVKKVVGVAHSGWRGTLQEIAKELILKMNSELGCRPEDIFVTVGPSIGPDSFEVGPEVATEFFMKFGREVIIEKNDKLHVDLWKALEITLSSVGVKHVEFSNIDTFKHTEYMYSYRKEGTKKRFAAIVGIMG
ncbi:MAG: peptidoglycan editing factor PgeF [Fervidobacterium sp.]|uniref:peptidoglycan editing factor PgeF n=1 Tax=Fervidobacterium sp. TaxID=1871331 RepID=UPI00404B94F3